jgi:nucleoside-diphosphate-sugar epimerase
MVTGAAGFIGANLCRRLAETGQDVHAVIVPGSNLWRLEDVASRLTIHMVDVRDAGATAALVERVRPHIVYHLATYGAYHHQVDSRRVLETNIFGLYNILQPCLGAGCELIVHAGTSSEYGRRREPMRESDPPSPNSWYAVAKTAQTYLCQHIAASEHLPVVVLRPFSVYGPWEQPGRLIPRLMAAVLEGGGIDMVGPDTARDFVYVDDVVDAFLAIESLRGCPGEVFNIGCGVETSLRKLIAIVESAFGTPLDVRWNAMPPRTWDTDHWQADISKAAARLGWRPKTSLTEGLAASLRWFEAHAALYARFRA